MIDWRRLLKSLGIEQLVAAGVLVGVALLLVPLPAVALDALLALNLAFALFLLLTVSTDRSESRLAALPAWLIVSSLARVALALGVARAAVTSGSPGSLVASLGAQMTASGENLPAGIAICIMLAIVAFVVIGMGVMRLAEVAARFALDALPGRQMALDAAVSAGRVDNEAAAVRGRSLEADNAFYGAMDGVARFLRGDAIACVVIAGLMPLGALGLGSGAGDLGGFAGSVSGAVGLAALLLASSLLTGAAAALSLARSTVDQKGAEGLRELLLQPALLAAMAVILLSLALVPGVAKLPLLGVAALAGAAAWYAHVTRRARAATEPNAGAPGLQLRLGLGLLGLLADHDLPALLARTRARAADELGFTIPPLTVTDDGGLPANGFVIAFGASTVSEGALRPGRLLLVSLAEAVLPAGGIEAELPDGRAGTWLRAGDETALPAGEYCRLEPLQVLAEHLRHVYHAHAAELFDLQRATEWLAAVQTTHPASVQALEGAGLGVVEVRGVGRALLREGIPLRERVTLVEAMAVSSGRSDAERAEVVRPALSRTITELVAPAGVAEVVRLGRELERELAVAVEQTPPGHDFALPPDQAEQWAQALQRLAERYCEPQRPAIILCPPHLRRAVAEMIIDAGAHLRAISAQELQPLTQVRVIHVVQTLAAAGPTVLQLREGVR